MSEPYTSTHIVHITDTTDRNAQLKIDSAYALHRGRTGLRDATYSFAPATSTLDIGIVVSELVNNTQRPDRLILAVNCAPPDKAGGTTDNVRNDFFCANLGNETYICGTSNGLEMAYVKGAIQDLFRLTVTNSLKSQFRSLEILPEYTLLFSDQQRRSQLVSSGILERIEHIDNIVPSVPDETHVIECDNFGNVKLCPSQQDLRLLHEREGNDVRFSFGKVSIETGSRVSQETGYPAVVAPTLFAAPLNTNVIALRSSSRRLGEDSHVPMIATIREKPAETTPNYDIPVVGAPVWLKPQASQLNAA